VSSAFDFSDNLFNGMRLCAMTPNHSKSSPFPGFVLGVLRVNTTVMPLEFHVIPTALRFAKEQSDEHHPGAVQAGG
jgi:hypothetical protein